MVLNVPSPETLESGRALTLAEWGDLPDEETGEFIDGQIVEDEEVGFLHDLVVAWFIHVVHDWLAPRGGLVGASDTRFAVSPTRGRKPDLSVYFPGRRPQAHGLVTVAPDIMIEVVSPRPNDIRRDRIEKLAEYATFGVQFYWIVDPAARILEIYDRREDGRYVRALGASAGVVTDVPGCDGLFLDLGSLWAEVDRLEQ